MPAASPPPPIGISTVSASGACSASSRPIVPWPAITRSSSNACTSVAPVRSTCACAAATASSKLSPASSVAPPYERVASTFAIGASCGMKIVAGIPASRAAHATAWPWLPALAATTPARRSVVAERRDRVVRAADLERARPLEVLGLEEDLAPGEPRERLRRIERRLARDAGEPLACGLDVSDRRRHRARTPPP